MLFSDKATKVWLCVEPVDLRKGFDGLYGVTSSFLKEDPRQGGIYLFTNTSHTRVKILGFDGTGLWVMSKRLCKGTFSWPRGVDCKDGKFRLTTEALILLLAGVDLKDATMRPWYQR